MQLADLVNTSITVAATRSRLKKRAALAESLRQAGVDDVATVVSYLSGTLPQGRIGIGHALLKDLESSPVAAEASLTVRDVDTAFDELAAVSGAGSKARRIELLEQLFGRATADEKDFLVRLLAGELRQGALEAVLIEAIAEATDLPLAPVRRAVMLAGDPPAVAVAALTDGEDGLARFRLTPLTPLQPMLAQTADDPHAAIEALGECAFEHKLDGARVQIHREGDRVKVFTRALNDVTDRVPEVVEAIKAMPARSLVLDGEVIALKEDGRPRPFQVTMQRFGRSRTADALKEELPLSVFLFDCLYLDGRELIDLGYRERMEALDSIAREDQRVGRLVTADPAAAKAFFDDARERGQEGLMAKALDSAYAAGARGGDWLKIKPVHTLDLVVLAAEWGSGRRRGWLSNLHLGARDGDGFVMLGKTFKGLTDALLEWQTAKFRELSVREEGHVVYLKPELVVEIAFNDIQKSRQYPGGMALRFARVKRYREDKTAADADTLDTVRAIFRRQFGEPH